MFNNFINAFNSAQSLMDTMFKNRIQSPLVRLMMTLCLSILFIIPVLVTFLFTDFFKRNADFARREKALSEGLNKISDAKNPELLMQALYELELLAGDDEKVFTAIFNQLSLKYDQNIDLLFSLFKWRPENELIGAPFMRHLWSYIEERKVKIDTPEHAADFLCMTIEHIGCQSSDLQNHLEMQSVDSMPAGTIKSLTEKGLRRGLITAKNFSIILEWFRLKSEPKRLFECLSRLSQDEITWIFPHLHEILQSVIIVQRASFEERLGLIRLVKDPEHIAYILLVLVAHSENNIPCVSAFLSTARDYQIRITQVASCLTTLCSGSNLASEDGTIIASKILLEICKLGPRPSTYQALYEKLFPRLVNILKNEGSETAKKDIALTVLLAPFMQIMNDSESMPFSKLLFTTIRTTLQPNESYPDLEKVISDYFTKQVHDQSLQHLFTYLPSLSKEEANTFITRLAKSHPSLIESANKNPAFFARIFFEKGRDDFLDMLPTLKACLPIIFADDICAPYVMKCYRDKYRELTEQTHTLAELYINPKDRFELACKYQDARRIISFSSEYTATEFWKLLLAFIPAAGLKAVCKLKEKKPSCTVAELQEDDELKSSWITFLRQHLLKTDAFRSDFRAAVKTCIPEASNYQITDDQMAKLDLYGLYFLINAGLLLPKQCLTLSPDLLHSLINAQAFEQAFAIQLRDSLTASKSTPEYSSCINALMLYTGIPIIRPHPTSHRRNAPSITLRAAPRAFLPLRETRTQIAPFPASKTSHTLFKRNGPPAARM